MVYWKVLIILIQHPSQYYFQHKELKALVYGILHIHFSFFMHIQMQIGLEMLITEKALLEVYSIWDHNWYLSLARNKVQFPYLQLKQNTWLLHIAAHNYCRWCKHYKIIKSHVLHPSPFYVIIQLWLVFRKIESCTQRPRTYPLSMTFYENKCLNKRLNWCTFPPKNNLLIYLWNLFSENNLNISDKISELFLPHHAAKTSFQRNASYTQISWSIVAYIREFLCL